MFSWDLTHLIIGSSLLFGKRRFVNSRTGVLVPHHHVRVGERAILKGSGPCDNSLHSPSPL